MIKIEREFKYRDHQCIVMFTTAGHRCGYVGVSPTSPLYKITDIDPFPKFPFIKVHGGITFTGTSKSFPTYNNQQLWWFGFDCAHANDLPDQKKQQEYFPKQPTRVSFFTGKVRRINYTKRNCKNLVKQLIILEESLKQLTTNK